MGVKQFGQGRGITLLFLVAALFLFFWPTSRTGSHTTSAVKMADSADITSKLRVSVRQTGTSSSPKLALAVTNTNPGPVTILSWNSPLDPLALQLGLVSFTPAGSDAPVAIRTIQIRRQMPPGPGSLVTIGAGQTEERELELKEPVVPLEKLRGGAAVSVVCSGEWMAVWPFEAADIPRESLESAGASDDAARGSFKSEPVDIEIP